MNDNEVILSSYLACFLLSFHPCFSVSAECPPDLEGEVIGHSHGTNPISVVAPMGSVAHHSHAHDETPQSSATMQHPVYNPLELPTTRAALAQLEPILLGSEKHTHHQELRLYSMRATYHAALLEQFYHQLMIPLFPLEHERDELDDWIQCLDPALPTNNEDEIIDMDVLILVRHNASQDPEIVAGIALEYYKPSRVGLISYLCVSPHHRRCGLMRLLHPVAVACLEALHAGSTGPTIAEPIRAILAETNTLTAGDASPALIGQRHTVLHRLGYRQLQVPYVQPPLEVDQDSFDDIVLLVLVGPNDNDDDKTNQSLDSQIVLDFVTDFYQSVYGPEAAHAYHRHWYYRVLSWFCHQTPRLGLVTTRPPWTEDCTPTCRAHWEASEQVVGIVGAGISGLVTAVALANQVLRRQQQGVQENEESSSLQPCTIHVWEAHDYVGGRIRTLLTQIPEDDPENDDDDSGEDNLEKQCRAFAPWPISMGAEFVHGVHGTLSHVIASQPDWNLEETFDLSSSSKEEEQEDAPLLLTRSATHRLSMAQRDYGAVRIFDNGRYTHSPRLWPFGLDGDNGSTSQDAFPQRVQRAKQIWNRVCHMVHQLETQQEIPPDMSLETYVRQHVYHDKDADPDEVEVVLQILEAVYVNTAASQNESFGIHEASREEEAWDHSEHNFRTAGVFADLIDYYMDQIHQLNAQGQGHVVICVHTSTPITRIRDYQSRVEVSKKDATTAMCDKVVVTVPLAVLKTNGILFEGAYALPPEKQSAIESVNMFSGMKIHVLLRRGVDISEIPLAIQFTELVFCPGEICVQIWFRRNADSVLVTGFVPANARDRLKAAVAERTEEESETACVQRLVLDQLHRMYNRETTTKEEVLFDSTPSCSAFCMHDWLEDEYVQGMYSSPSVGAGWQDSSSDRTCRHDLASPIRNTVFFAGEHTNVSTSASVQAAMDSGLRAADQVYKSLEEMS